MADITKKEAEEIMRRLEAQGSFNISLIERTVEEKVREYRDKLNAEIINEVKKKSESGGAIPCDCGGTAEGKGVKKKRFS